MVLSKPRIFGTLTVTVVCNLRLCDDSIINLLTLVIGHLVFIDVLVGVDECGTGGVVIVDTGLTLEALNLCVSISNVKMVAITCKVFGIQGVFLVRMITVHELDFYRCSWSICSIRRVVSIPKSGNILKPDTCCHKYYNKKCCKSSYCCFSFSFHKLLLALKIFVCRIKFVT